MFNSHYRRTDMTLLFQLIQTHTLLSKLDLMVQRLCLHTLYRFCKHSEDGVSHRVTSKLCLCLGFCLLFYKYNICSMSYSDKKGVSESKAVRLSEFFPGCSLLLPSTDVPLQPNGYCMYHHVYHSKLYVLLT
jgi:hypothetical protein